MSADRLREAAKVLRSLAEVGDARNYPLPWSYADEDVEGFISFRVECRDGDVVENVDELQARWFTTMHPGVGLALADWLDAFALIDEHNAKWWVVASRGFIDTPGMSKALAVADAILGGAS